MALLSNHRAAGLRCNEQQVHELSLRAIIIPFLKIETGGTPIRLFSSGCDYGFGDGEFLFSEGGKVLEELPIFRSKRPRFAIKDAKCPHLESIQV